MKREIIEYLVVWFGGLLKLSLLATKLKRFGRAVIFGYVVVSLGYLVFDLMRAGDMLKGVL